MDIVNAGASALRSTVTLTILVTATARNAVACMERRTPLLRAFRERVLIMSLGRMTSAITHHLMTTKECFVRIAAQTLWLSSTRSPTSIT
tara:strand:- start:151 stop:420 length:270 start_codon:yes stop_codon:yes gene_type:complete